jgi:hypothetical protein
MNTKSRLPSKSKLASILVFAVFGYAFLEYSSFFLIVDLTKEQRALVNRMGIFFGYLGAVVGGSFLFWDHLAANEEDQANVAIDTLTAQIDLLKKLEAEAPRGLSTLAERSESDVAEHQKDLAEAQSYQRDKSWLGSVCLAFIAISATCQLIAASDSP